MKLNDITPIKLKLPIPWHTALEAVVGTQDEESQGIIAGGALRALYMQTMFKLPAVINDVDIFADCGQRRVPNTQKLESVFGQPINFRSTTFLQGGPPKLRMDYLVNPLHFAGAPMLQVNIEHKSPWADIEGYLMGSNLGINQIAYDGHRTFVTRLFLNDMRDETITFNPWMDWTHDNLSRTVRKVNDLRHRPEFAGFKVKPAPVVRFPYAEGDFWEHLAHLHNEGDRD